MNIELPVIFRVGAEVRLLDSLRLEGAFVWERWSRQEEISIQPIDVTLTDVTAIGDYAVGALSKIVMLKRMGRVMGPLHRWSVGVSEGKDERCRAVRLSPRRGGGARPQEPLVGPVPETSDEAGLVTESR